MRDDRMVGNPAMNTYFKGDTPVAKAKKSNPKPSNSVPEPVAAMLAINPTLSKAWVDLMSESARFMSERLARDLELQQDMLACRNPAEFLQLQTEFLTEAMEQYTKETTRYSRMMFKSLDEISKDARAGHRREYDDVPI